MTLSVMMEVMRDNAAKLVTVNQIAIARAPTVRTERKRFQIKNVAWTFHN